MSKAKAKVQNIQVTQEQADAMLAAMEAVKAVLDATTPKGKLYQENLFNAQKLITDQILGQGYMN